MTLNSLFVVEDDDALRTQMVRAFRSRDWLVEEAYDLDSVQAALRKATFDFSLVDLRLGTASGLIVVREILARCPAARVFLLTGYGSIESAVEAM